MFKKEGGRESLFFSLRLVCGTQTNDSVTGLDRSVPLCLLSPLTLSGSTEKCLGLGWMIDKGLKTVLLRDVCSQPCMQTRVTAAVLLESIYSRLAVGLWQSQALKTEEQIVVRLVPLSCPWWQERWLMWASETVPRTVATELNLVGMYWQSECGVFFLGECCGDCCGQAEKMVSGRLPF